VAELVALGGQVALVVLVGGHLQGHALGDLQTVAAHRVVLAGVVREQAHLAHAEVAQDLRAHAVVADVGGQAQGLVRVDRVEALRLLQVVGLHLVGQPDAAALLLAHVEHDALALGGHALHRGRELAPAVAAQRAEHVAGQALAVHAHEHRPVQPVLQARRRLAHGQRDVLALVDRRAVQVRAVAAVPRGQVDRDDELDEPLGAAAEADQVGDRHDEQPVAAREGHQVGHARHRAVLVHDLADHGHRTGAGEARQVDGALGLARAAQHAARHRAQREDVARAHEVLGPALRIGGDLDRARAVGGRDAGGHAGARLDRHGEGRAQARLVALDLQRQVELVGDALLHGQADQAARVARHEVDDLGRHGLGQADQVALVLAVLVVDEDRQAAGLELLDGLGHRRGDARLAHGAPSSPPSLPPPPPGSPPPESPSPESPPLSPASPSSGAGPPTPAGTSTSALAAGASGAAEATASPSCSVISRTPCVPRPILLMSEAGVRTTCPPAVM
jgi:hypothetical protein